MKPLMIINQAPMSGQYYNKVLVFTFQLFSRLKEEQPKFRHQIVAISGDCSLPSLGISAADRALLSREVSIVFHVAATVRFDEKLKLAVAINVQSPRDIMNLCKEMPKLKVCVLEKFRENVVDSGALESLEYR